MPHIRLVFTLLGVGLFAGASMAAPAGIFPTSLEVDSRIVIQTGVDGKTIEVDLSKPLSTPPNRVAPFGPATDLVIDPAYFGPNRRLNQAGSSIYPESDIIMPSQRPGDLNGLRFFFSSASGGFGFRMGFDRRMSPRWRFMAGPEFLTYGLLQAADRLGSAMPPNVTRITLISIPVGLQRQFRSSGRVVPHVGVGVGPVLRFDHQSIGPGFYPGYGGYGYGPGGVRINTGAGYSGNGIGLGVGLPFDEFPQVSLTAGGFVSSGMHVRLRKKKDLAISVEGRYSLTRFTDALGSPGDFSGFSVAIGFGKYF